MLYLSVHDNEHPAEIFLRLKGSDSSSELIGLYNVIALLMNLTIKIDSIYTEAPSATVPIRAFTMFPERNSLAKNQG